MTESRHTPLPWDVFAMGEIVGGGKGHLQRVVRTDWEHAPEAEIREREANAALIVRAVNCHDEMVEALRGIDEFAWSSMKADCEEARVEAMRRIDACRDALKKAR